MEQPRLRDQRAFLLLFGGQSLSGIGSMLLYFALLIGVFSVTHSGRITAIVFVAETAPLALLSLRAGRLADVANRRLLIVGADLGRAALLIPLLTPGIFHHTALLCGVVAVQSALNAVFHPAFQALLPSSVPPELLPQANSAWASAQAVAQLVAPFAGGALYSAIGLRPLVLVDLATFVVSALLTAQVQVPAVLLPNDDTASLGGIALIRRSATLWWLFVGFLAFGAMQPLLSPVLVPYLQGTLHGSPTLVGLAFTLFAATTAASAPFAGRLIRAYGLRAVAFGSGLLVTPLFVVFASAPRLAVALALFALCGLPVAWFQVSLDTWLQVATPSHQLGRVNGAINAFTSLVGLAASAAPVLLIGRLGPRSLLYMGAAMLLLGTVTTTRAAVPGSAAAAAPPGAELSTSSTGG